MLRLISCCLAGLVTFSMLTATTSAVVVEQAVTPASVQAKDSKFSVTAEQGKDGLIQFTITYRPPEPQYLVAHFVLRDGKTVLSRSDAPSFVREPSATYYVAISPEQLAGASFELSQNDFRDVAGQPVAEPRGTIFQIDREAFGKIAPAAKGN